MATRGIINGSIINYQVSFEVPANTEAIKGILIRDDLPAGLTYAENPGVTWSTGGSENLVPSFRPYTGDDPETAAIEFLLSRVQILITAQAIVKNSDATPKEYTINIPAKVVDSTKLVLDPEANIKNEFQLYSTVEDPATTTPDVDTHEIPDTWLAGEGENSSTSDLFINYLLTVKGDLKRLTNDTPQTSESGYDFNVLNTVVPTTDKDSTFTYVLTIGLDETSTTKHLKTLATTDAQNATRVYFLNGDEKINVDTNKYTVAQVDSSEYTVTIPYNSEWKTRVLQVYVPFTFDPAIAIDDFGTADSITLRNPIKVELKNANDNNNVVLTTNSYADVIVEKPVLTPHISFGGKKLN